MPEAQWKLTIHSILPSGQAVEVSKPKSYASEKLAKRVATSAIRKFGKQKNIEGCRFVARIEEPNGRAYLFLNETF